MKKKIIKYAISICLILISYAYIYYKITHNKELKNISFPFQDFTVKQYIIFCFCFLLMFINWGIEAYKWKKLVEKIENISLFYAFKAVMAGISIGIFTPNRIGEIGGRTIFLKKENRISGILSSGTGSVAQLISTLIIGLFGFVLFLFFFPEKTNINNTLFNKISVTLLFSLIILLCWCFFNLKLLKPFLLKFSFLQSKKEQLNFLSEISFNDLYLVLFLSISRYIVFAFQFYLLLLFFDIQLNPLQAFTSISLIYLFATLIPSGILAELGIRGSLSIFFVGLFSQNVLGAILATSILWLINLVIPSVIGSVYFIKYKL